MGEGGRGGGPSLALCGLLIVAGSCAIAWGHVLGYFALGFIPLFGGQLAAYGVAVRLVLRRALPARQTMRLLFAVALVARLVSVPFVPVASDDIYRYIWDGRVQAAGINPYDFPPVAPDLSRFRDAEIYPGINRKPVRTIYPPVAQTTFRALYAVVPDSIPWTKLAFSLVDMGTVAVLASLLRRLAMRPELALLYAWHPLAILEVGHSGHVDAVAVFLFAVALAARLALRPGLSGVALAGATLVKFYALVAAPALLRMGDWRRDAWGIVRFGVAFAAFVVVAYVPFLGAGANILGYLPGYVAEEGFDTGERYQLLRPLLWLARGFPAPVRSAVPVCYQAGLLLAMAGLALTFLLRPPSSPGAVAERAIALFVTLFALASPSQPWYLLLLLACTPLASGRVRLAGLIAVSCAGWDYLHWWLPGHPEWPLLVVHGGRVVALALVASAAQAAWRGRSAVGVPRPA